MMYLEWAVAGTVYVFVVEISFMLTTDNKLTEGPEGKLVEQYRRTDCT
jgi:hypothetical protein